MPITAARKRIWAPTRAWSSNAELALIDFCLSCKVKASVARRLFLKKIIFQLLVLTSSDSQKQGKGDDSNLWNVLRGMLTSPKDMNKM